MSSRRDHWWSLLDVPNAERTWQSIDLLLWEGYASQTADLFVAPKMLTSIKYTNNEAPAEITVSTLGSAAALQFPRRHFAQNILASEADWFSQYTVACRPLFFSYYLGLQPAYTLFIMCNQPSPLHPGTNTTHIYGEEVPPLNFATDWMGVATTFAVFSATLTGIYPNAGDSHDDWIFAIVVLGTKGNTHKSDA
ncbi:hypothetical protein BDV39DRAFT_206853 [Aspergillus sergii]|uniref:Uncharacterized protein n=1 Tax=Aspergillus sergii TaxID=1034303 RepID=A0A5N6WX75_9EURO|nr:hypothetical protein BDV39DRAFT_206853 [Aspergillus sergii]